MELLRRMILEGEIMERFGCDLAYRNALNRELLRETEENE